MPGIEIVFGSGSTPMPVLQSASGKGSSAETASPRILIVEDEVFVALHLQTILESLNFPVEGIVGSGREAVDFALSREVDILVIDVNLGAGIDGVEAARQIQAKRDIPVIFVTAYSTPSTVERVRNTVRNHHIVSKPISSDRLEKILVELSA